MCVLALRGSRVWRTLYLFGQRKRPFTCKRARRDISRERELWSFDRSTNERSRLVYFSRCGPHEINYMLVDILKDKRRCKMKFKLDMVETRGNDLLFCFSVRFIFTTFFSGTNIK